MNPEAYDDEFDRLLQDRTTNVSPAEAIFMLDHGPSGPHWREHQEKGEDYGYRLLDEVIAETSGKFQWILSAIVAAAYFVDAAETTMIGLLLPSLEQQFNVTESGIVIIPACTNVGMLIGAIGFSQMSNIYGRRFTILISMCICALFGFLSSFSDSLGMFSALRLLLGIGYGGNLVTATTLLVEFVSSESRGTYVCAGGLGFGIGAVVIAGATWGVVPNIGWRWLLRIASFIAIPVIIALYFIPESPRFYIMTHQFDKAVATMQRVCEINDTALPHRFNQNTLEAVQYVYEDDRVTVRKTIALILRGYILKALIPLALCWLLNSFAGVILAFIPLHASRIYGNPDSTDNIVYAVGLTQSIGGLMGTLAQLLLINFVTRLLQLRAGFFIQTVLIMLLGVFQSHGYAWIITLAFVTTFVEQFIIGTLYLYTPEAYPTRIRANAFAICQAMHRIAPVGSPFAVAALDQKSLSLTCYVYGCIFFLGGVMAMFVRIETFNKELVEESDFHEPLTKKLDDTEIL